MKFNKIFISVSLFFIGLSSWAWEAPVFQGEYVFAEDRIEVYLEKEEILIKALTAESHTEMRDLKIKGFQCEARGAQVYSCTRKAYNAELPGQLKDEVIGEYRGQRLNFMEAPTAMEVLNGAERLVEWRVWQNVKVFDHMFQTAKYILIRTPNSPDLLKLEFFDSEQKFYFVQQGENFVSQYVKTVGKEKSRDFYLAHNKTYTMGLLFSPLAR